MATINESFCTIAGKQIFQMVSQPESQPAQANVILTHGIGEHCGRYLHVMKAFAAENIAVHGFDLPGHGKTSGKRGVLSYPEAWKILNFIKQRLLESNPAIPLYLYGHSMGGAIVLSYAYRFSASLNGIVVTSPGIRMNKPLPKPLVSLLTPIASLFPELTIANHLPLDGLSHDPSVEINYRSDPLTHNRVSLRLGLDLIRQGQLLIEEKESFPLPLFLLQGTADELVDPAATDLFSHKLNAASRYLPVESGFHELHNEPEKEMYIHWIIDWVKMNISAALSPEHVNCM